MRAIEGARYRVISDPDNFFQSGEIVVALETSVVPYCVREEKYVPGCNKNLSPGDYRPLLDTELEMLDYQPYLEEKSRKEQKWRD